MSNARKLAANLPKEGQLFERNVLVNGAMNIAQRATSASGVCASSGYYVCDRWAIGASTSGRFSMAQNTDSPNGFNNSLSLACTTADTSIASTESLVLRQIIEGQNLQQFAKGSSDAKEFAVSFYVKGNASATYTCELFDGDNSRQISKTFSVTTSWTRVVLTFPADTTGAFADDNGISLYFNIWLHAGSNFTSGTLNSTSWAANTNANRVSSSQTSFLDSTSRVFYITGIQLEAEGAGATPFEHEPYETTLRKCQRYYHNSFHAGKTPGVDTADANHIITTSWNDGNCNFPPFPVVMRGAPTITLRSRNTNNTAKVTQNSSEKTAHVSGIGTKGGEYVQITSGGAGLWTAFSYECDAEL